MNSTARHHMLSFKLCLLATLVAFSLLLFGLQSWLYTSGGWLLVVLGLAALWSGLLAAGRALLSHRRRRRAQALEEAAYEFRRAVYEDAQRDQG
jgi:protein-S-isoprenylcysteine O-methyltransferase Ste14